MALKHLDFIYNLEAGQQTIRLRWSSAGVNTATIQLQLQHIRGDEVIATRTATMGSGGNSSTIGQNVVQGDILRVLSLTDVKDCYFRLNGFQDGSYNPFADNAFIWDNTNEADYGFCSLESTISISDLILKTPSKLKKCIDASMFEDVNFGKNDYKYIDLRVKLPKTTNQVCNLVLGQNFECTQLDNGLGWNVSSGYYGTGTYFYYDIKVNSITANVALKNRISVIREGNKQLLLDAGIPSNLIRIMLSKLAYGNIELDALAFGGCERLSVGYKNMEQINTITE